MATTSTDSTPHWASGCPSCKAIWLLFSDPVSASGINLGSSQEALSTTCPNHKVLLEKFNDYVVSQGPHGEDFNDDSIVEFPKPRKGSSVAVSQLLDKDGCHWSLLLAKKDDVPGHPGKGRILNADWVDIEMIKKWKYRCITSHGTKCENPLKVWPTRPAWLVDVQKQCIVPVNKPVDYVAISYAYGSHSPPVITLPAFEELQKPFALETPEFSNFVSPIIRHAMYLTSAIDERYLWADALCVTHHDPKAASEQLRSMGAIYANAIVTIIATDGDSGSGISGLKGISDPRGLNQSVIPFGEENIILRNTSFLDEMIFFSTRPGTYYQRGWTCQEYAMAKRKIIFYDHEVHWVCSCSLWHEELTTFTEIDDELHLQSNIVMAGFPDDSSLSRYFCEYNQRSLTFEEDALPALSGLLSVFSRSFEGGFLYGIPEMFFEHSLCWRATGMEGLQRRIASTRPIESRFEYSDLPSWSWLGWKGSFLDRGQSAIRVGSNYSREQQQVEEAFPITEWYTGRSPADPHHLRRRIRPTWFEKREGYKDFTKPLPPGWKRLSAPGNKPRIYPDGCGKYLFQHEYMLDHDGRPLYWHYPFPVNEIQESTPPFMPEQTPYLFCETVQARLSGHQQDPDKLYMPWDNEAKLCDRFGKYIGRLDLHNKETRDRFPEKVTEGEKGLQVDIVAVCRLKRRSMPWSQEHWETRLPLSEKDLYLVLWVEWKDGVAYRLASGEVIAAEWESLDLQKVSLVLG
ncbi:heterokaryon incompatibility protein [Fusarium napiforme]|uniref:Heterokaryon incompatibility protein n=1 Tax=Fusarium napiforme TaxID=42672 RepID=A0A8H5K4T2_9HYPO|nr:heterokaryon incompatibility protein [Fusarium napiforme]